MSAPLRLVEKPVVEEPSAEPLGDLLPIAVRAYCENVEDDKSKKKKKKSQGKAPRGPSKPRLGKPRPDVLWAIDCETVTQETISHPNLMPGFSPMVWRPEAQALLFGSAHRHIWRNGKLVRTHEYTFFPDELPAPTLAKLKRRWFYDHKPLGDWWEPKDKASVGVRAYCIPLSKFMKVFWREAVERPSLIAEFNLPFDESRQAFYVGQSKPQKNSRRFAGGFSFALWKTQAGEEDTYKPRLRIKQISEKAAFMEFAAYRVRGDRKYKHPGAELLDLHQLVFALTGHSLSLDDACAAMGMVGEDDHKAEHRGYGVISLRFLRYNRQDVLLTARLAVAALERFDQHEVSRGHSPRGALSECRVYSPASVGKAYLRAMGLRPRLELQPNFPKRVLAATMESFSASRAEVWIRKEPVPVAALDLSSTFPTIAVLLGQWAFVTAESVDVADASSEVQAFLDNVTPDRLWDPAVWKSELNAFALIQPDGDILPTRAQYASKGKVWKIALAPYTSGEHPQWYTVMDLLVSKLRTGRAPKVIEAFRLVPHGIMPGLRPIRFAGTVDIDPAQDDFFRKAVEERARIQQGLSPYDGLDEFQRITRAQEVKLTSNALCWGVNMETHESKMTGRKKQKIRLWLPGQSVRRGGPADVREDETSYPEERGPWFFPPMAALNTAGARLILALIQHEAESRGASYVAMDTDSISVTYHPDGGVLRIQGEERPINLLTPTELGDIIAKVNRLRSVFGPAIKSIIKQEHDQGDRPLWSYAIIAKRYCLFTVPETYGMDVHRAMAAGDFDIVDRMESALGGILPTTDDPEWITTWWRDILMRRAPSMPEGPLVRKFSCSSWEVYKRFETLNEDRDYQQQSVKPFNFFMAVTPVQPFWADPAGPPHALIAAFDPNPRSWLKRKWIDTGTGERVPITTRMAALADVVPDRIYVKTIHSFFNEYHSRHPAELRPPMGGWEAGGTLRLRPVRRDSITLLGKDDVAFAELSMTGLVETHALEMEVQPVWATSLLPILADIDKAHLYEWLEVDPSTLHCWMSGEALPSEQSHTRIEEICAEHAGSTLKLIGVSVPAHPANARELYGGLLPELKASIARVLGSASDKKGFRAVSRETGFNRETIRRWIGDPTAIRVGSVIRDLALYSPATLRAIASLIGGDPKTAAVVKATGRPKTGARAKTGSPKVKTHGATRAAKVA